MTKKLKKNRFFLFLSEKNWEKNVLNTAGLEDFQKNQKNQFFRTPKIKDRKKNRSARTVESITLCWGGGIKNIIFIVIYAISIKII